MKDTSNQFWEVPSWVVLVALEGPVKGYIRLYSDPWGPIFGQLFESGKFNQSTNPMATMVKLMMMTMMIMLKSFMTMTIRWDYDDDDDDNDDGMKMMMMMTTDHGPFV